MYYVITTLWAVPSTDCISLSIKILIKHFSRKITTHHVSLWESFKKSKIEIRTISS